MLTTIEVSLQMAEEQKRAVQHLEKQGFFYPRLVLMNRGDLKFRPDFQNLYPSILEICYDESGVEALTGCCSDIRTTVLWLRCAGSDDDAAVERIIADVNFRYEPDAIGFIAQSIYKNMLLRDRDRLKSGELLSDPDTIRVLHSCFFLRQGPSAGNLMITPYVVHDLEVSDIPGAEETQHHQIATIQGAWIAGSNEFKPRFDNPFGL